MNPRHGGKSPKDNANTTANISYFDGHVDGFDPRDIWPADDQWAPSRKARIVAPLLRIQDQ